jgi:hypothetical protein
MMRDTGQLLRDMYGIACVQAELGKDDLSLAIDWPALRLRFEDALVREGVPVPDRPVLKEESG